MRRCHAAVNDRVKSSRAILMWGVAPMLLVGACATASGDQLAVVPTEGEGQPDSSSAMLDPCAKPNLTTVEPGALTFVTSPPPAPPFFLTEDPADRQGLEADLAYILAEELGYRSSQVTWEFVDPQELLSGEFVDYDIAVGSFSRRSANPSTMVFTQPYLQADLIVTTEDPDAASTLSGVPESGESRSDVLRWGFPVQGPVALWLAEEGRVIDDPVTFSGADQLVATGPVRRSTDVIVVDEYALRWLENVAQERLTPIAGLDPPAVEYALGLVAGNPLAICVDRALSEMSENGRLGDLQDLWLDPVRWAED